MANVLKVTTPGAGFDNTSIKNTPHPKEQIQIQNPIDPNKVTRSDNRTDSGQGQGNLEFHYESNFNTFLQMIQSSPRLLGQLADVMFQGMSQAAAGTDASAAYQETLMKLVEMMQMNAEDILPYLKEQVTSAARFQGGLFTLLRQAMNETASVTVKSEILNFLKHFNDLSSGSHLLESIRMTTESIKNQMFQKSRAELDKLLGEIRWDAAPGDTEGNAALLKGKIIPFLAAYINATKDMGKIRDDISLLMILTSRYENGEMEESVQSFGRLLAYQDVKKFLGELDEQQLGEILGRTDFETASGKTEWSSLFQSLVKMGAKGEAGLENKAIFLDMLHSMVSSESVYMPLVHLLFPLNFGGRMMMSEMWIDPDRENDSAYAGERQARSQKLFIKFDIQNLGLFEVVLICKEQDISMQLRYPEQLRSFESDMQANLSQIVRRNGYRMEQMVLEVAKEPLTVLQVFPEIYERKNSVNVRI